MKKMWTGVTSGETSSIADRFNSSIKVDSRMYRQDIIGSMAHASMLGVKGIISKQEADAIIDGLQTILDDIETGTLIIDDSAEDIHMYVEAILSERIGDTGKKLHTARSRNDQVTLDLRLFLKDEIEIIKNEIKNLLAVIIQLSSENIDTIMPGYTHLQRAQPITFSHHLLAYGMMLQRDLQRLENCKNNMDVSPIGCCALAGTTYDTDRYYEAEKLGFNSIALNSVDGVSDRDYCVELLGCISVIMMHLSRFSEELVLWSSWEFKFIELSDAFTTGSSIMPQKKNPDMAELVRGKTGRVYGDLFSLLTILKGLPLAYNKDMQEDKETVFDAVDTVKLCLEIFCGMLSSVSVKKENMKRAAQKGFINATDLADYLVRKGLPFRDAYKISGEIVSDCINNNYVLEEYPLEEYKKKSNLFDSDVYKYIDLSYCVKQRISDGGPSEDSIIKQIEFLKQYL